MPHESSLIATIVSGIGLAFIFGTIANRLRISPLVGYLLAGVVVGPFTPGFIADQGLAPHLAEIGVILLMFGVGLHFSLQDLLAIRAIVIPGAVAQVTASAALGWILAWLWGWSGIGGAVFGVALSVASTVVLMRGLQERHLVETDRGHIVIGWLVVQDLLMVIVLVLLPALAGALGGTGATGAGTIDFGALAVGGGVRLVVVANPCLAFVAARLFGARADAALLLAAGLAQIGEFSFILADLGIGLGALPERARHLILAGSILSILVNPLVFALPNWLLPRFRRHRAPAAAPLESPGDAPLLP